MAISYDPPETLKKFADSRGITFPLLSDPGSAIIRRYGLLNETVDPKTPLLRRAASRHLHPRRQGRVSWRASSRMRTRSATPPRPFSPPVAWTPARHRRHGQTPHLSLRATISDTEQVAPGERLTIVMQVTPRSHMHLYAPGKHDYQVVQLTLDPQPWLRVHETQLSAFGDLPLQAARRAGGGLREAVPACARRHLLATPEAQKQLGAMSSVTLDRRIGVPGVRRCDLLQPGEGAGVVHVEAEAAGPTAARLVEPSSSGDVSTECNRSCFFAGCHRLQRTRDLTKYERGE